MCKFVSKNLVKKAFISRIRALEEYAVWKDAVLRRDVKTYPVIPKKLQVHHIKSIELIINENHIETIDDAKECVELWDTDNGCVITAGEHLIITWLMRKKSTSQGLIAYLKFFIKEHDGKYYEWCSI